MGSALLLLLAMAVMLNYGMLGERHRGIFRKAMRPALAAGAIGLALGFFGPIVWTPAANPGPLLGIFVTGPLGLVAGLVYGVAREYRGQRSVR